MARNKHLWIRLQSLEDEYRALTLSSLSAGPDPLAYRSPSRFTFGSDEAMDRVYMIHKEISALRTRFGIEPEGLHRAEPTRPRIVLYSLPPGRMHPVTPQEIQQTLAEIPAWDVDGLRAILLTDARRDRHASYGGRQVKLCYPVDSQYRVRLRRNEGWSEVCRFGAWVEEEDGARYVCWEPEDLKAYVLRHLLLHEIGHHVAFQRGLAVTTYATRREEEFAESYAHAYYDPER